jgi:hypothetical protein
MPRRRRPNPRLAKMHRSYRVEEIAQIYDCHKNTVRNWIKNGLRTIDGERPALIQGRELARFLSDRRRKARQHCPAGHIYCVKCREPKPPAGDMADYLPIGPRWGSLIGICPDCGILIYRRVSLARLDAIRADLEITFRKLPGHITEMSTLS